MASVFRVWLQLTGTDRGLAITEEDGRFGQIAKRRQELDTVTCVPRFCVTGGSVGPVFSYADGRWSQLGPIRPPASVVKAALRGAGLGDVHFACFADSRCVAVSIFGGDFGPTFSLVSTHD